MCLEVVVDGLGGDLERFGASWGVFEASCSVLEPSWERLGVVLGWLRPSEPFRLANSRPGRAAKNTELRFPPPDPTPQPQYTATL